MNKKMITLALVVASATPFTTNGRTFFFDAHDLFNHLLRHESEHTQPMLQEISKPGSDKYIYQLNVPGYDESDLQVSFNESINMITISAQSRSENKTDDTNEQGDTVHSERSRSQSFSTSFTAPDDCVLNTITYSVTKGQMIITIDKTAPSAKKGWQKVTPQNTQKTPAKA